MNSKITKILLVAIALIMLVGTISASAITPYTTYTYSINGTMQLSPHAYTPEKVIDARRLNDSLKPDGGASDNAKLLYGNTTIELKGPKDIFVDGLNHLYIVNTESNQIIVTDEEFNVRLIISEFTNKFGVPDSLKAPSGVFVNADEIFVADTGNSRIVVFDKLGNFVDIVPEPASEVLPDNSVYQPVAVAVDKAGRIYVVSSTTNYGVISLNRDGSFNGFIGPQKVTYNAWEYFLRLFKTAEQLKASEANVSTEFNNLCIDADGFIYVTTNSIEESSMASAITGKSKSGDFAPVKKLNPNGTDVMHRNGFWPPSGEISFNNVATTEFTISGPSSIVDVALGPNNTWSIIDTKRSKVFTYDNNGNLLYAFGDKGNQLGNIQNLQAIDYQGTKILLLDRATNSITIYKRTGYGDLLNAAIQNTEDKQYEKAVDFYLNILQRNMNYDAAYIGIANSLYRDGEYIQAMKYYKYAYNTEDYSEAYQSYRKEWMEDYLWVIPVVVFGLIFGISKFFKFANKVNKRGQKDKEKRTFGEEILYAFHIIFHPFDGFWDLKHEKRGSVRGAIFWLVVTCFAFIYQSVGLGYLRNPMGGGMSYFMSCISILSPVILWVVANWCITTLFEGEGSFKDVFIATCYSLVPLPMLIIPGVMLTNVMTASEMAIYDLMLGFAFLWLGLLVFFGMMVTHDYTLGKNFITAIVSIVGVAFIIFIVGLFSTLVAKVFTFFYNIYVELSYRWS
jgi:DNA-binding beta-propeller fold protein YncE